MKSLTDLLLCVLADASASCNVAPQTRDIETIISRVEHEGLSFLTITLADLGKTFDRSIEIGQWQVVASFARKKQEALPKFLRGLLCLVFDVRSGEMLRDASIEAIEGIRQICRMLSKIKMECTNERQANAEHKFIQCEADLHAFKPNEWQDRSLFKQVSRLLFGSVFSLVSDKLARIELMPKHGPGATEDGTKGDLKYRFKCWPKRLDSVFPISDYISHNYMGFAERSWSDISLLSKGEEPPVRVVFVPKTLKTPRVIAIEPVHNMFVQQALCREIVLQLENDPLVSRSIHFTDQTVNATIAVTSSRTKQYATLDLTDASDRVHASLANDLFDSYPLLKRAVFACRSSKAKLPSGKVIPLRKFASMGSAMCFPVEAMVFLVLTVVAALKQRGVRPTCGRVRDILSHVHVYGDDITVPVDYLDSTIATLEQACLKVNRAKTFARSHFRESCGADAYNGYLVTPVYVRSLAPTDRSDGNAIASWIASSNLFYKKGYWQSSRFIRSVVERIVGVVPHVTELSSIQGWTSFQGWSSFNRWNQALYRVECKGLTFTPRKYKTPLSGAELLFKYFVTCGMTPREQSLLEYTLQYNARMRYTWASA